MKYKLIIFDWDGTLMDSIDKIVLCMQQASQQQGLIKPTECEVKNIIGLSLYIAMEKLFPENTTQQHQAMVNAYKHQYKLLDHIETPFYRGINDLLKQLIEDGYKLAVATGKGRDGLNRMLALTNSQHYFSATICADEAHSKPDPLMLNRLLEQLQFAKNEAIMIGDSLYDLNMANNAGIDCLGVSYGVHDKRVLQQANPIAVVDDLAQELKRLI